MQNSQVLSYADAFVDVLETGETLQWTGRPKAGMLFRTSDVTMIPFSLMWCGFACFWEASVLGLTGFSRNGGAPLLFELWGIPFVVIGIYLVIGRFFYDAWRRSRTYYAVTNSRVLIVEQKLDVKVTSLALRNLPAMIRTTRANRNGSLSFGTPAIQGRLARSQQWSNTPTCPTFEFIPNVREVETLIRSSESALREPWILGQHLPNTIKNVADFGGLMASRDD